MNNPYQNTTPPVQEKLAKTVSIIVLIGTCLFGILGIVMAIVAMFSPNGSITEAKSIFQTLMSAILPLFGTWIGTILAFYFSKENLTAANQTVQFLANKLTSDKVLASIKAREVMIPLDQLIYKEYRKNTDPATINLKSDFLDFLEKKQISRILLLDELKQAKYVIHKSIIESFVTQQFFAQPAIPTNNTITQKIQTLTFADFLKSEDAKIKQILIDGVKFIKNDATLEDAKLVMKNTKVCNDIFITESGLGNSPVIGWITDKTIVENSEVK